MKNITTLTNLYVPSLLLIIFAFVIAACSAEGEFDEIGELIPAPIQETLPDPLLPEPFDPEAPIPVEPVATEAAMDDYPPAVEAAIKMVIASEDLSADEVEVISFTSAEWPDGCLGLAEPGEACTLAIVSGWLIILQVNEQRYEVRTDETGSNVRWRWEFTQELEESAGQSEQ